MAVQPDTNTGSINYGLPRLVYNPAGVLDINTGSINYGIPRLVIQKIPVLQPLIAVVIPTNIQRSETINITILGTNLLEDSTWSFSGSGITINQSTRISDTKWILNISVSATAALGYRNVSIVTTDIESYTYANAVKIVDYEISLYETDDYGFNYRILQYDKDMNFTNDVTEFVSGWSIDINAYDDRREKTISLQFTQEIIGYDNSFFRVQQEITYKEVTTVYELGWYTLRSPSNAIEGYGKTVSINGYDGVYKLQIKKLYDSYTLASGSDVEQSLQILLNTFLFNRYVKPRINETFAEEVVGSDEETIADLLTKVMEIYDLEYFYDERNRLVITTVGTGKFYGDILLAGDQKTIGLSQSVNEDKLYNRVKLEYGDSLSRAIVESQDLNNSEASIYGVVSLLETADYIDNSDDAQTKSDQLLLKGRTSAKEIRIIGTFYDVKIRDLFRYDREKYEVVGIRFSPNEPVQIQARLYEEDEE